MNATQSTLDLRPQGVVDTIARLLAQLEALDVHVDGADRWRTLRNLTGPTEPKAPGNLLECTPEQIADLITSLATWRAIGNGGHQERTKVIELLDQAMAERVKAQADDLVTQLRKRFDAAVEVLRRARELEITTDDDARSMLRASDEVRGVWLRLDEVGADLDRILYARQQLSTVVGVAPTIAGARLTVNELDALARGIGVSKINWSVTVTSAGSTAALAVRDGSNSWSRWLDLADDLELRLPSELTDDDLIRAYHGDLAASLYAEAEHRAERTETEEVDQ